MSLETEKFLKAEESAENIVEALKKLNTEASNYKTSKDELDNVRIKLVNFITVLSGISESIKQSIDVLKSIGGPEILSLLKKISTDLNSSLTNISHDLNIKYHENLRVTNGIKVLTIISLIISLSGLVLIILIFLK